MRNHGALMFTGWVALAPLGILAARHRWLFARHDGMWFQVGQQRTPCIHVSRLGCFYGAVHGLNAQTECEAP